MKKGWQKKKLCEIYDVRDGTHDSPKYYATGYPLITSKNLKQEGLSFDDVKLISELDYKKINERSAVNRGDVLFAMIGTIGNPTIVTIEPNFAIKNVALFKVPSCQSSAFLKYYLESEWVVSKMIEESKGATQKFVGLGYLRNFPILLPTFSEQKRIVAILDEAFAGIATAKANTEKNLQNARAIFESYLCSVFKQSGEGWVEKTLGEIGKVSMCKRIFKEETLTTAGIPFYKIGTFGKEPDSFIPARIYDEYKQNYPFPKKGDVLISASGTIGRRVKYDGKPAYFQDSNIVWIENDEKQVLNDYLYHFYGACEWNSTKGATISRLYNDNLRRIVITFPESFQEQRQIVGQLDVLTSETQRLATVYQQKLTTLDELKKSLLHQAFSGEL